MDARQFDALTRILSRPGPRRRLLGVLAAVPLLGGLLAFLDPDEGEAKDRRRRRKQRHKKRKDKSHGKRKKGKQGCKPKSRATVCAGKCGAVKSRQTCGKTVDCGSCDCSPACGECFTCQGTVGAPGTCVPQAGAPCGAAATCTDGELQPRGTCDGSGTCQPAAPVSCEPYTRCAGNACASSCDGNDDCVAGSFCLNGQCVGDRENGADCTHDGQCISGHCVESICCDSTCTEACKACNLPGSVGTCSPRPATTPCGDATTCLGSTLYPQGSCTSGGVCQPADPVSCAPYRCDGDGEACATSCSGDSDCSSGYFCDGDECVPDRANGAVCQTGSQCASGHCVNAVCCVTASCGTCQVCDLSGNGTCSTALDGTDCGGDNVCCGGTCQECCDNAQCHTPSRPICTDGVCELCTSNAQCGSNALCVDGQCHACDVTCTTGTAAECGDALRAKLGGNQDTLYVCPGTYQGGFTINRNVTIIGAGEGAEPAGNTVLHGGDTQRVVDITSGTVTLQRLHVTHGNAGEFRGGGIQATTGVGLTMEAVTVAENRGHTGGGISSGRASLTMTRCTVRDNQALGNVPTEGGGISCDGPATLTDCWILDNTSLHYGGGINLETRAQLTLAGATLIEGNGAFRGGGIFSNAREENSGKATIGKDCRITGNTAQAGWGGGIYRALSGQVILEGPDPSPIVTNNCHENCAGYPGYPIEGCAAEPVPCEV